MRIRGAILDELRRLDWMPRSARHRARQLRQNGVTRLEQSLGRAPTLDETREKLGLNRIDFLINSSYGCSQYAFSRWTNPWNAIMALP